MLGLIYLFHLSSFFKEWDLVENFQGVLEYQTRYAFFKLIPNYFDIASMQTLV